ncbi:MAG: EthD domain-containing protein [Pseudomonadota bacterium]
MVKILYFVIRRPDLSAEAFRTALRAAQARIAPTLKERLGAVSHSVSAPACAKRSHCLAASRHLGGAAPDAVIEIAWANVDAYDQAMGSPGGLAALDAMVASERAWVDFQRSAAMLAVTQSVSGAHSKDELLDEES